MLRPSHPLLALLFTLLILVPPTLARAPPTSFCKCICFTNSTIIPLNSSPSTQSQSPPQTHGLLSSREEDIDGHDSTTHKRLTCNDCTRAFCLDYNLPICKGAKEDDVFTSCFQRDSLKDETIVLLFIVVTTGLLGWAVLKPWVDKLRDTETVQRYAPVENSNLAGLGRGGAASVARGGLPAYRDSRERRPGTRDRGGSESFVRQGGLNS